jgi:hypothetical protein
MITPRSNYEFLVLVEISALYRYFIITVSSHCYRTAFSSKKILSESLNRNKRASTACTDVSVHKNIQNRTKTHWC